MSAVVFDPSRLEQNGESKPTGRREGFIGRATVDLALHKRPLKKSVRHVSFGPGNPIAYCPS